jgi:predicted nucleotidyltransferase
MMEKNEIISYAMDFASYVISKVEGIESILLYGSVSRGDFTKNSDIDLFFDTKEKMVEDKIKKLLENYRETRRSKEWKLKGLDYEISVIVGDLNSNEWKDLKRAITNTGTILYGKYKSKVEKINQYVIISFEKIRPEEKRVSLHRSLFGFKTSKKHYSGLIDKYRGKKIGKGTIIIPAEYAQEIKSLFDKLKIPVKIYDVWSDDKITD